MSPSVAENLQLLENENTLTVTTGHQLCLMTGPLYFIYKIVSTIKLCRQLNEQSPDLNFVPIYWMATEDHDFEEISAFIFGVKIPMEYRVGRRCGKINPEFKAAFGFIQTRTGQQYQFQCIKNFKKKLRPEVICPMRPGSLCIPFLRPGLLIIDGDDKALKTHFVPYLKEELQKQSCAQSVLSQIET